jgi:signal transduction histidine kinase
VPHRVDSLLTACPDDDVRALLAGQVQWPRYSAIASAIGVSAVALITFVSSESHVDRPLLFGLLLVLAAAPFVVQSIKDFPHEYLALFALVPLALLNLAGPALGVMDPGGRDQTSLLIAVWLVGETAAVGRRRDVVIVTSAALAIGVGRVTVDTSYSAGLIWSVGIGIAFLAGLFIRTLVVALLNAKMAEAALRDQAITEERQRIAREVHDVIAHSMTVTMLHLTAARMAVARGDSTAATEALEEAEKAGRTSLNEIRHTVGLLRTDAPQPATAPLPSAGDVPALVAGYETAGVDVTLDVRGDLARIDPAAGLALYRIVQESLTNAGRHAPGSRTTVHIEVGPPLRVDVASDGGMPTDEPGSGLGLAGMAERAAALGGRLEAGRHGTGWRVAAMIP